MATNKKLKFKVDSVNNIILNWGDLKRISDLSYSDRKEAGIYVWGFTIENTFIPYYVGIADNISLRMFEHINSIISGRYTIFHCNSLANFKDFKNQDIQQDKTNGKVYIPKWPYNFKEFLDNRKELRPHIDFMVDTFTFSYAVVDRKYISGQDLKEIEKICINQLGKENLCNTRAGHSARFILDHIGNKEMADSFNGRKAK